MPGPFGLDVAERDAVPRYDEVRHPVVGARLLRYEGGVTTRAQFSNEQSVKRGVQRGLGKHVVHLSERADVPHEREEVVVRHEPSMISRRLSRGAQRGEQ